MLPVLFLCARYEHVQRHFTPGRDGCLPRRKPGPPTSVEPPVPATTSAHRVR